MVETWLHLDHSFFLGIYNILFRLGKTTKEFNAGKRARHVPPFRFYLVISLLFFFLILPGHDQLEKLQEMKERADTLTREADARARRSVELAQSAATSAGPVVSGERHSKRNKPDSTLDAAIKEKLAHPVETASTLLHGLPKALLACLPVFALITRVLYRKSGYVYIQHLILAFNLHSFVFLWWSTTLGWYRITELLVPVLTGWLVFAAVLFTFWTYYRALKDVFERSWKATIVLGTFSGIAYSLLLVAAVSAATLMFLYI